MELYMSRILKTSHLFSLSLGLLSSAALVFNLVIFILLYPQVTQLLELAPRWESYGIVAAINIIIIALFQLSSVITLLADMIIQKRTSTLVILAVSTGIISGLMILADISLLSDIGTEYEMGWQTRGEWIILFISYGLHILSLLLTLIALRRNLHQDKKPAEHVLKDEVLFLSLHTTGVICGCLGLVGVLSGLLSGLSLWMMERITVILSLVILAPYLVILGIWLCRQRFGQVSSGLDEKQFQDLATAGLWSLVIILPLMVVFFALRFSHLYHESWTVLWLPLLIFLAVTSFSSLTLHYFKEYS